MHLTHTMAGIVSPTPDIPPSQRHSTYLTASLQKPAHMVENKCTLQIMIFENYQSFTPNRMMNLCIFRGWGGQGWRVMAHSRPAVWTSTFLAPGTNLMETIFPWTAVGDGLGMTEAHYICCALYFESNATADLIGYWLMAQRLGNLALDDD